MKFNVSKWDGYKWVYLATVKAENEQDAAKSVAQRFNLKGKFASHPHIDTYTGQKTSDSAFTNIA